MMPEHDDAENALEVWAKTRGGAIGWTKRKVAPLDSFYFADIPDGDGGVIRYEGANWPELLDRCLAAPTAPEPPPEPALAPVASPEYKWPSGPL
jgi:hypothetical protein